MKENRKENKNKKDVNLTLKKAQPTSMASFGLNWRQIEISVYKFCYMV